MFTSCILFEASAGDESAVTLREKMKVKAHTVNSPGNPLNDDVVLRIVTCVQWWFYIFSLENQIVILLPRKTVSSINGFLPSQLKPST